MIDMAPGAQEVLIMQDPGLSYLPLGGDESGGLTADRLLIRLIGVFWRERKKPGEACLMESRPTGSTGGGGGRRNMSQERRRWGRRRGVRGVGWLESSIKKWNSIKIPAASNVTPGIKHFYG